MALANAITTYDDDDFYRPPFPTVAGLMYPALSKLTVRGFTLAMTPAENYWRQIISASQGERETCLLALAMPSLWNLFDQPKLRGRIERVFRSFITLLMPYLTGRTFSNPQERGDYPSQKYAVHTAESIVELLVRFTVDVYHNRKHRGLEYASPNIVWDRLIKEFGWSPPMNNHTLREPSTQVIR